MEAEKGRGIRREFYFLKSKADGSGLLDLVTEKDLIEGRKFAVCRNAKNPLDEQKTLRLYSAHESPESFFEKMRKLEEKDWNFFEIIFGDQRQKPFFDIDVLRAESENSEAEIDEMVEEFAKEACRIARRKLWGNPEPIIFKGRDAKKLSYHVVLNGLCFKDHIDNRSFCEMATKPCPPGLKKFVDTCVYKSLQQYRLPWNRKVGSERVKIPLGDLRMTPENFSKCLVTTTEKCSLCDVDKEDFFHKKPPHSVMLLDDFEKIKSKFSEIDFSALHVREIKENIILLNSSRPYWCPLCK